MGEVRRVAVVFSKKLKNPFLGTVAGSEDRIGEYGID